MSCSYTLRLHEPSGCGTWVPTPPAVSSEPEEADNTESQPLGTSATPGHEQIEQTEQPTTPREDDTENEEVEMIVERKIKVVTEQHNINKPPIQEGFPMKEWTIEVYILDQNGEEHPARCFTKVVYNLHPSFANPIQTFTEPPFKCTNEGWGEFELMIDLYTTEKGGKNTVLHDLNFAKPTYENIHKVVFKNPSQALQQILRETGPLPSDEERKTKKADVSGRSKKRAYDIEKIAEGLPKLGEDDLLQVIQMIHDGKSDNTYMQNNVDAGEFTVDLYTLSDEVLTQLWELLNRVGLIA